MLIGMIEAYNIYRLIKAILNRFKQSFYCLGSKSRLKNKGLKAELFKLAQKQKKSQFVLNVKIKGTGKLKKHPSEKA